VISRFYLAALPVPGLRLGGVFDPDPERMDAAEPPARRYGSADELLADPGIDAVVINAPNDLHYELAQRALAGGKDVCVEKPLTLAPAEARELQAAAAETERVLDVAFHRRFNVHLRRLGQEMAGRRAQGAQIVGCRASYAEDIREHAGSDSWYLDPARCGGGAIADNGPNVFDALRCLLGDVRISTVDVSSWDQGVDMKSTIIAEAAGVPVHITLDWHYTMGEDKNVIVDWADGTTSTCNYLESFPGWKQSLFHEYEGVLRHFSGLLDNAGKAPRHGEDGVAAVELVSDAYELANAGGGASS
jgi:predicted dehydrogenase